MTGAGYLASVVTLDGPSGAGKGTVGLRLAAHLGWNFLDSGLLYRLLVWEAERKAVDLNNEEKLAVLARHIEPIFNIQKIQAHSYVLKMFCDSQEITDIVRSEVYSLKASRVAAYSAVRLALLETQRNFLKPPGLVADGRDMGTLVFPMAVCKFFLTADPEARVKRRYLQLKQQGNYASLTEIKASLWERDNKDQARTTAALKAAPGAYIIDTTYLSVEEVLLIIEKKLSEVGISFLNNIN